ncbi:MAG: T9SS type A sorting domain-containing protein, partial [Bacteroidales bacterium]|nr:T9SS type A sorting domain-containing protein [Bacteroidales bacterium]
ADAIYVGMDVGVFYRDSNSADWVPFMKNLPNVIINELEIFYPDQKIRAATYGRGLWESPLFHLANSIESSTSRELDAIKVVPNPVSDILSIYLENAVFNDTKVELFSTNGKLITSLIISNTDNYKLNMSNLTEGIYLLKISNNLQTVTKKVVKF